MRIEHGAHRRVKLRGIGGARLLVCIVGGACSASISAFRLCPSSGETLASGDTLGSITSSVGAGITLAPEETLASGDALGCAAR